MNARLRAEIDLNYFEHFLRKSWFPYSCNCCNSVGDWSGISLRYLTTVVFSYRCNCCNWNRPISLELRTSRFLKYPVFYTLHIEGTYDVSREPNGLNMVFHTITIARIIYTVRNRSLLKTHLLTVNLKRPLRTFELAYDSQFFGVDIIRNFFSKTFTI